VAIAVSRETFEKMVVAGIEALPPGFLEQLANLDFTVEDWATHEDYARTSTAPGSTLLAVYRGIPLTRRGRGYNMILPDRIVFFQQPIQRMASTEDELAERVTHIVRHEVAHYFGISDDRLRELEAY
jgi:predicted Zn-dependent protease with MMP-like domain